VDYHRGRPVGDDAVAAERVLSLGRPARWSGRRRGGCPTWARAVAWKPHGNSGALHRRGLASVLRHKHLTNFIAPSRRKRTPLHKGVKGRGGFRAGWPVGQKQSCPGVRAARLGYSAIAIRSHILERISAFFASYSVSVIRPASIISLSCFNFWTGSSEATGACV